MKTATPDDNPPGLLASKAPDDKLYLAVGSGASIDAASPSVELATARDGTAVHLRPLRRDERELVARFFAGCRRSPGAAGSCSPCSGCPRPCCDGPCVGIASWIALADEPGAAEVAVAVTDRYQGLGIGRLLVEALCPLAARAGLTCLVYLVDPTNRPALRLLWSLGVELAFRDGLVEGRQCLPRRPLLDASSSSGPAPGGWPCRAGPSTRQLPIRVLTAPSTFPCMGRPTFAGTVPRGRSPTGGRRARRHGGRLGDQTIRHRAGETAAQGRWHGRAARQRDDQRAP